MAQPPLHITITKNPQPQAFAEGMPATGEQGTSTTLLPSTPDDSNLGNVFLAQYQQADTADAIRRLKAFTDEPAVQSGAGRAAASGVSGGAATPEPDTRTLLQRVIDGAKDVAKGSTQAVPQAVGGASDAVKELMTSSEHLADWLDKQAGGLKIPMPIAAVRRLPIVGPATSVMSDDTVAGWMENPEKMIRDLMPTIGRADTVTGNMVRDTSQFLTGMYMGSRALGAFGLELGGTAKAAATGAMADFATRNPDSGRLSDLLAAQPRLQNPVTSFLKSNPDDPEAEKRLKNSLEGLGLGALAQGLVHGVKVVRAQMVAKGGKKAATELARDPLAEARAQYGEMAPADIGVGDLNRPLVSTLKLDRGDQLRTGTRARAAVKATETGVPDDVAARGIAGAAKVGEVGERGIYVNYSRIDTPDDVKSAIDQVAEAFKGKIDEARRGVQTNQETKALAESMGLTVDDVLARQAGQPWSAEKALAARQLMNGTAQRLVEAAQRAAGPTATAADLFAFRKLLAVHTAVQTEVIAARTETARALQAWAIPADFGGVELSRHVQGLLEGQGGETTKQMAAALAKLQATSPTPEGLNTFIRTLGLGKSFEAVKSAWIAGLLSNPKTHIVNASSNLLTLMGQVYERRAAAAIGQALGTEGAVAPAEALSMLYGIQESMGEAFKASWKALSTGESTMAWGTKFEDTMQRARPISAEAFNLGDNAMGRSVDYLGKVFDVPGRLLGASDDFFKTIAYRAEVHAQAIRTAFAEGLEGEAAAARIGEILLNPPESIRLAAQDGALYATFTNKTGNVGQALMALRTKVPATAIVMPFVKTPVNISRYAFERSPLAPLVSQWRADIAAAGARRDLALARMSTGSVLMLTAFGYADQGVLSGAGVYAKSEQAKRETDQRQGWQPYAVKVGDKWVSYNRLDPFGMTMGFAADFAEMIKRSDLEADKMDEIEEVLAAGVAAISNATVSKTYLSGASQFFGMMGDPTQGTKGYLGRLIGSTVPAGESFAAQMVDPTQRETMKILDYAQARLAVLAERLPPRLDLWGNPDPANTRANAILPARASDLKTSPIDAEMKRLGIGIDRIKQKGDWDGVPVNLGDWPQVYTAYQKLAGNDLKHPAWGQGAKDFLDAVVSGKSPMSEVYRVAVDQPDAGKGAFIKKQVEEYRKLARTAIMADPKFQDFANSVRDAQKAKLARRVPALQ